MERGQFKKSDNNGKCNSSQLPDADEPSNNDLVINTSVQLSSWSAVNTYETIVLRDDFFFENFAYEQDEIYDYDDAEFNDDFLDSDHDDD